MTKIKDMPSQERPMERLLQYGAGHLSNEDLLAILLKTGTKQQSSKEIATSVLATIPNIQGLQTLRKEQFLKFTGIGPMKASILLAAIELGKRMHRSVDQIQGTKFHHARLIFEYYEGILRYQKQEYVYGIYLDSQKRILQDKLLFIGTLNYSMVHPREIFKEAYLVGATSIICVHNHPSGDSHPSKEDHQMTKHLRTAGNLLGIPLLDHIIIGKEEYYSFYENGDIQ